MCAIFDCQEWAIYSCQLHLDGHAATRTHVPPQSGTRVMALSSLGRPRFCRHRPVHVAGLVACGGAADRAPRAWRPSSRARSMRLRRPSSRWAGCSFAAVVLLGTVSGCRRERSVSAGRAWSDRTPERLTFRAHPDQLRLPSGMARRHRFSTPVRLGLPRQISMEFLCKTSLSGAT